MMNGVCQNISKGDHVDFRPIHPMWQAQMDVAGWQTARRGGRARRRFQQGGHTHEMLHYGFHHTHQNGQTVYDPYNFGFSGPMLGYDPNGQPIIFETSTQEAGGHNHPTAIQRRQRGGRMRRRRRRRR